MKKNMMNIGIDLLPFGENLTGVGVYVKNLLDRWIEYCKHIEFHLFLEIKSFNNFHYDHRNCNIHVYRFKNRIHRIFFEQTFFIFELRKYKINKLFAPANIKPVFYGGETVLTIHDLIPFITREKFSFLRHFYMKYMTYYSILTAQKIIAVSKNTKSDIKKYCKKEKNVFFVYNGLDKRKVYLTDINKDDYRVNWLKTHEYFLFVGTIGPGKNILTMLLAFEKFLIKNKNIEVYFVLVGSTDCFSKYYDKLLEYINKSFIKDKVIFKGYIQDEEMIIIYKYAKIFVYVSLYEGFGLPVLEAMANQLPVITSNCSSMPEIVGSYGCIVNPRDHQEISLAYATLYFDEIYINQLIENQNKQLDLFSWDNCAQETIEIICS